MLQLDHRPVSNASAGSRLLRREDSRPINDCPAPGMTEEFDSFAGSYCSSTGDPGAWRICCRGPLQDPSPYRWAASSCNSNEQCVDGESDLGASMAICAKVEVARPFPGRKMIGCPGPGMGEGYNTFIASTCVPSMTTRKYQILCAIPGLGRTLNTAIGRGSCNTNEECVAYTGSPDSLSPLLHVAECRTVS